MKKIKEWLASVKKAWGETYFKRISSFLIINAVLWIWASYYLAWMDRIQIAQDLSKTALTTILGTVIANAGKSTAENISKYGFVGKTSKKKFTDFDE